MDGDHAGRAGRLRTVATVLSIGLIGLWVAWWVASVRHDAMVLGPSTWVPPLAFLTGDFKVHIEHVARLRAEGVDIHHNPSDWVCALYQYPPMLTRSFAWVRLFDPWTAARAWQAMLALLMTSGALAAWRTRRSLGLAEIPPAPAVAAVLFSTPALFAMERGQSDPMIFAPLIAAAWLLGHRRPWTEVAAGAMLGATAWLKYYPGVVAVALLALGRRRALAAFVAVAAVIGVVDRDAVRQSIHNAGIGAALMADKVPYVHPTKHSLVENWKMLGVVRHSRVLRQVPGEVAAAVLLLPAVVAVSRRVARSADPRPLVFPYFLWLVAAATYGMPQSNDYNLVALPLATLAVWDRRDPWPVQAALGLLLVWWQPVRLPIGGAWLLAFKLGGLYAVGACLIARATREASEIARPAFARVGRGRSRTSEPEALGGAVPGSRST